MTLDEQLKFMWQKYSYDKSSIWTSQEANYMYTKPTVCKHFFFCITRCLNKSSSLKLLISNLNEFLNWKGVMQRSTAFSSPSSLWQKGNLVYRRRFFGIYRPRSQQVLSEFFAICRYRTVTPLIMFLIKRESYFYNWNRRVFVSSKRKNRSRHWLSLGTKSKIQM